MESLFTGKRERDAYIKVSTRVALGNKKQFHLNGLGLTVTRSAKAAMTFSLMLLS
jgi:hypothetical protein